MDSILQCRSTTANPAEVTIVFYPYTVLFDSTAIDTSLPETFRQHLLGKTPNPGSIASGWGLTGSVGAVDGTGAGNADGSQTGYLIPEKLFLQTRNKFGDHVGFRKLTFTVTPDTNADFSAYAYGAIASSACAGAPVTAGLLFGCWSEDALSGTKASGAAVTLAVLDLPKFDDAMNAAGTLATASVKFGVQTPYLLSDGVTTAAFTSDEQPLPFPSYNSVPPGPKSISAASFAANAIFTDADLTV
jgi:hypothetical protein